MNKEEIQVKAYRMTVKDFLKDVLDKKITTDTQIKYESGYYTFYLDNFRFINNFNGTGLNIINILEDKIEVFE